MDMGGTAPSTKKKSRQGVGQDSLSPFADRVLAPGDEAVDLHSLASRGGSSGAGGAGAGETQRQATGAVLRLGSGLRQDGSRVVATRAGVLRSQNQRKLWVESSLKRYTPGLDEEVLGIVVEKHADNFDVDIRGPSLALLPVLAFEGATRRNRPNIEIGAAVYARVVKTHPDAIPDLSCTDESGKSSGFGPLIGGFVFECSTGLARSLLELARPGVLEALGSAFSFEMAVGLNGRVWVKGESMPVTILVANAIQASEGKSSAQQRILVKALMQAFRERE